MFPDAVIQRYPFGQWFAVELSPAGAPMEVVFAHGGWGKISAAASAQYAIGAWRPCLLVNLGTCGGFEGYVHLGDVLLVRRTVVYDIVEQMADYYEAIEHYSTDIDLSWLSEPPVPVIQAVLASGDRDLLPKDVKWLNERFGAVAGDWESGAIAYVARQNGVQSLVLRGVSDIVGEDGSDTYGDLDLFRSRAEEIMGRLVADLASWLEVFPFHECPRIASG